MQICASVKPCNDGPCSRTFEMSVKTLVCPKSLELICKFSKFEFFDPDYACDVSEKSWHDQVMTGVRLGFFGVHHYNSIDTLWIYTDGP